MIRISLVFLGQTGAGPVYSLEMAKALFMRDDCCLQIIISKDVINLNAWNKLFANTSVDYYIIDSYKHTKTSVLLNFFNFPKQERLVNLIRQFGADVLYVPFGLLWAQYVYWRLHNKVIIVSTLHDVDLHDSFMDLSVVEIGSYILKYGSGRYVDKYVILNQKDKSIVERRTGKPVCVIPHASFAYYFNGSSIEINNRIHNCIGFFGRIEVYKGLELLIHALKKVRVENLKLLIAGNGTISKELLDEINSNSQIELINRYIEDGEFQDLLARVDFVVLPYKRASQSGVIPMCFAAGKTVVATNVGALSEQVREGTGILCKPEVEDLARSITELYSYPSLIFEMGKNAKYYAETELTWEHSAELLLNYCKI